MWRAAAGFWFATALSACTTVQVVGAKPLPRLWAFAPIRLAPDPSTPVLLVTSRGLGLVPGNNGLTLGYRSETWALVSDPNQCRVIFFSSPEDLTRDPVARMLAARLKEGELCLLTTGERRRR